MRRIVRLKRACPRVVESLRKVILLSTMLTVALASLICFRNDRARAWFAGREGAGQASLHQYRTELSKPRVVREKLPVGVFMASISPDHQEEANSGGLVPDVFAKVPHESERMDLAVFEGIRDKTRVIPPKAYFHLLNVARLTPEETMEQNARRGLTFAQFVSSPDDYRGQAVLLKGHVRRMTEIKVAANSEGIDRLYEGWLFTEESQDNPYVIIVSRLPQNFPLGGNIVEDVSFAGFFLKLWAYRAGDGDRYAPLLLGHRIVWYPRPLPLSTSGQMHAMMLGIVAFLFAAFLAVLWWTRRSAAALRAAYDSRSERPISEDAQTMSQLAGMSTEEFLSTLEQDSQRNTSSGEEKD